MIDSKVCPIMSRPYTRKINNDGFINDDERLNEVPCLESRCMAWVPPTGRGKEQGIVQNHLSSGVIN